MTPIAGSTFEPPLQTPDDYQRYAENLRAELHQAVVDAYESATYLEQQVDEQTDGPATIRACAQEFAARIDRIDTRALLAFGTIESVIERLRTVLAQRDQALAEVDARRAFDALLDDLGWL